MVLSHGLVDAKSSFKASPELNAPKWKRVVVLLGGDSQQEKLPWNWEKALKLTSGLFRIHLDIRPNPDSRRPAVIAQLSSTPPDALIVWTDYVRTHKPYTAAYQRAKPSSPCVILGPSLTTDSFIDVIDEFVLQLFEVESALDKGVRATTLTNWDKGAKKVLALESSYFVMSDRLKASLPNCNYPDISRMIRHLEYLEDLARLYHESGGKLGNSIENTATQRYGIEIALFDSKLDPADVILEGEAQAGLKALPHIKVDDYKSPDRCGRVYFAIDSVNSRFIVDHVGLHDYR
ncbi:MAG TPA: hypothetical protein VF557_03605 [Jatrophihabitans sp.]|jgi:hypothetical protein|uniref:hypothetical protein n=1 Tax=Jatrophihabitans sp. TaxID=1932789 RepID=UPI002EE71CD2